jgi:hypothetical protein
MLMRWSPSSTPRVGAGHGVILPQGRSFEANKFIQWRKHAMPLHSALSRGSRGNMQRNSSLLGAAPAGLVVMLSLALMINYIDRGAIATAAPRSM